MWKYLMICPTIPPLTFFHLATGVVIKWDETFTGRVDFLWNNSIGVPSTYGLKIFGWNNPDAAGLGHSVRLEVSIIQGNFPSLTWWGGILNLTWPVGGWQHQVVPIFDQFGSPSNFKDCHIYARPWDATDGPV
jgi:hypothetical protein